eukprot:817649-Pelagomonas_calceolata.AAC.3
MQCSPSNASALASAAQPAACDAPTAGNGIGGVCEEEGEGDERAGAKRQRRSGAGRQGGVHRPGGCSCLQEPPGHQADSSSSSSSQSQ